MAESGCYGCNDANKLTNGDRIRQMTDEELSVWLDCIGSCYVCKFYENKDVECNRSIDCCKDGMLKWLKSEVDSNEL